MQASTVTALFVQAAPAPSHRIHSLSIHCNPARQLCARRHRHFYNANKNSSIRVPSILMTSSENNNGTPTSNNITTTTTNDTATSSTNVSTNNFSYNSSVYKFITNRLLSGYEPTPEILAILSAYFVQGALGISRLAISFFLKDELHLTPAVTSALTGIAIIPWLIKPLYGFITDAFPIGGYRRRPYLLGAAALGVSSWLTLSLGVQDVTSAVIAIVCSSLSVAVTDVVADSLVVERVRGLPTSHAGALQSLCWGTSAIGGLLSAYFSGSLLDAFGTRVIFGMTAVLPLLTGTLSLFISEECLYENGSENEKDKRTTFQSILKEKGGSLWSALSTPSVYLPALFVFLWQGTPCPDAALFYFQTNVLHFGPEFLGRIRLTSSIASLIGIYIYNVYLREINLQKLFLYATLISVPLSLSQVLLVTRINLSLGISDQIFALADSAVLTVIGQVAFMPTLVLAARLCPPGVEGTLFAALMSVFNASGAVSNELGALLTSLLHVTESNFDNLALLVTLCSLAFVLPLPLLGLLDSVSMDEQSNDNEKSNLDTVVTSSTSTTTTTSPLPTSKQMGKKD